MAARLEDMASERLTRAAYEGLYEALNLKRLIAFVGSGVSLVYGNLTWEQFKKQVISRTREKLQKAQINAAATAKRDLTRALDALSALETSGLDQVGVVFELCERAFNAVQEGGDRTTSSFGKMLGEIFISDKYFATETLVGRLDRVNKAARRSWKKEAESERLRAMAPADFFSGLSDFYSKETLAQLAGSADRECESSLTELLAELRLAPLPDARHPEALPVDRRSLVNVFLAFAGCPAVADQRFRKCFPRPEDDKDDAPRLAPVEPRPRLDPLLRLRDIGIRRFLTTNYDIELENLFMFRDVRGQTRCPVDVDTLRLIPGFTVTDEGRSWERRLANGLVVRSDVYDGMSTARLFEFGIGSVDNHIHIYHLHGRADQPKTMVATDSDYNRQYREERISRPSFDRAYDVAISGNPILFVGSGMSEAELTRTLRNRVSNPRLHRDSPVFVLRPAHGEPAQLILDQLDLYTRLGVHVIHFGHPRRGEEWSLRRSLLLIDALAHRYNLPDSEQGRSWRDKAPRASKSEKKAAAGWVRAGDLAGFPLLSALEYDGAVVKWLMHPDRQTKWKTLGRNQHAKALLADYLGKLVEKVNTAALVHELEQIGPEAGAFFQHKSTPIEPRVVWAYGKRGNFSMPTADRFGVRHLPTLSGDEEPSDRITWQERRQPHRVLTDIENVMDLVPEGARPGSAAANDPSAMRGATIVFGDRGTRKGTLLAEIAQGLMGREHSLIVNCSFGLEADSAVGMVEDFLIDRLLDPSVRTPRHEDEGYESRREKMDAKLRALEQDPTRHPLLVIGAVDRLFGLDGQPLSAEFDWLLRRLLDPMAMSLLIIGSRRVERYFRALVARIESERAERPGYLPEHVPQFRMVSIERSLRRPTDSTPHLPAAERARRTRDFVASAAAWPGDDRSGRAVADALAKTSPDRRASVVAARALDALRDNDCVNDDASPADIGRLAQEILKTLAFIGLPCEGEVLLLAPAVRRLLTQSIPTVPHKSSAAKEDRRKRRLKLFLDALDLAMKRKLLIVIEPSGWRPVTPYAEARAAALQAGAAGIGQPPPWPAEATPAQYAIGTRQRFVLHRMVFQEMRYRYGLPLGETVLNSNFNLSLFAAQTEDAPTAQPETAAVLEDLADFLMNGWKDVELSSDTPVADLRGADVELARLGQARLACVNKNFLADARNPDRLAVLDDFERRIKMHGSLAPLSLRAAGGVIRSLFSVSSILGLDVAFARASAPAAAVTTQQKRRIRKLLDMTIDLQAARLKRNEAGKADLEALWTMTLERRLGAPLAGADIVSRSQKLFTDEGRLIRSWIESAQAREDKGGAYADQLIRPLWAELAGIATDENQPANTLQRWPFYEEEIVWLLNERGVLSLAQGDLYAAETTFALALAANTELEGECYYPNRCRLVVNRALLWIERGKINEARRCLDDLRRGLGEERGESQSDSETRLILALAEGYEALCDDLQGLTERADLGYRRAIRRLEGLRQHRAVAVFQCHRGMLLQLQPGAEQEAARCFARGLAAGEAGRHTDIVYRIRVAKAEVDRRRRVIDEGEALAIHRAAREYGEQFDMHRVTVQALSASSQLRLEVGEVEAAANDASRALALATRYGMALSRIALRILSGRALEKRGDVANARFMFERALSAAERIGYQRAVDSASARLMRPAQDHALPA